jgi:hypothetical protein
MVILKFGGVYADVDVECRKPLDGVVLPTDTMIVGWEAEVPTDEDALKLTYTRRRQILQWFFAAAPGHPVLRKICDSIAANVYTRFSDDANRDTLERTGPGIWTDSVLEYALQHPPSPRETWSVRILPRIAFGMHDLGFEGMPPSDPLVVIIHHFLGSWKVEESWRDCHTSRCVAHWISQKIRR